MTGNVLASVVVPIVLVAGCARSAAPEARDTGIQGTVRVGPACPVERAESPCPDRPLSTELQFLRGSEVVASVRSGEDGRFSVALEPGIYTIRSTSTGPPSFDPVQVRVPPTAYAGVTLTFDSGIR